MQIVIALKYLDETEHLVPQLMRTIINDLALNIIGFSQLYMNVK